MATTPTPDNDQLVGTSGNDTIDGLAGDDLIQGLAGNDTLIGGEGNDTLEGGEGNDTLRGGAGNDSLDGGIGTNFLDGGDGNDSLKNHLGTVDGGEGYDVLAVDFSGVTANQGVINYWNESFRFDIPGVVRLLTHSNLKNFEILGSNQGDNLTVSAGDKVDAAEGTDLLNLALGSATTSVHLDLTQSDNLINFGSTQVKNFETISIVQTGSGDDIIKLNPTASTANGSVISHCNKAGVLGMEQKFVA